MQPVKENVPVLILIGADQYWRLLARFENALSDAFHHLGIKGPSPYRRHVNSVDCDVFWLAHDDHAKAGLRGHSSLTTKRRRLKAQSRKRPLSNRSQWITNESLVWERSTLTLLTLFAILGQRARRSVGCTIEWLHSAPGACLDKAQQHAATKKFDASVQ